MIVVALPFAHGGPSEISRACRHLTRAVRVLAAAGAGPTDGSVPRIATPIAAGLAGRSFPGALSMALGRLVLAPLGARQEIAAGSGEPNGVDLNHRTYTTPLALERRDTSARARAFPSRDEREPYPMADDKQLYLGAFLYALRRLPDGIVAAELVLMGQSEDVLQPRASISAAARGWKQ